MEDIQRLYDEETPVRPVKSSPRVKDIKFNIKEFICEIPSCVMIDSGLRNSLEGARYLYAWNRSLTRLESKVMVPRRDHSC